MPRFYFSLSQIVLSSEKDITVKGLVQTYLPHYIGSIILSAVLIGKNAESVILYGFFTSFLIVWPPILYSRELIDSTAYNKKNTLYLIYLVYIVSVIFVTNGGFMTYVMITENFLSQNLFIPEFLKFYETLHPLYQNLLACTIYGGITGFFICLYRKLAKRIFNPKIEEQYDQ